MPTITTTDEVLEYGQPVFNVPKSTNQQSCFGVRKSHDSRLPDKFLDLDLKISILADHFSGANQEFHSTKAKDF